jgi:hypothetical protein
MRMGRVANTEVVVGAGGGDGGGVGLGLGLACGSSARADVEPQRIPAATNTIAAAR